MMVAEGSGLTLLTFALVMFLRAASQRVRLGIVDYWLII